jgi:hypothetical protein
MVFKVSESTLGLKKKAKNLGKYKIFLMTVYMTFKVSESTLGLKKAKNLGKYKIFLMTVYMIFKYGKRFRLRSIV